MVYQLNGKGENRGILSSSRESNPKSRACRPKMVITNNVQTPKQGPRHLPSCRADSSWAPIGWWSLYFCSCLQVAGRSGISQSAKPTGTAVGVVVIIGTRSAPRKDGSCFKATDDTGRRRPRKGNEGNRYSPEDGSCALNRTSWTLDSSGCNFADVDRHTYKLGTSQSDSLPESSRF
jgi:hypothetical protein